MQLGIVIWFALGGALVGSVAGWWVGKTIAKIVIRRRRTKAQKRVVELLQQHGLNDSG